MFNSLTTVKCRHATYISSMEANILYQALNKITFNSQQILKFKQKNWSRRSGVEPIFRPKEIDTSLEQSKDGPNIIPAYY